MDHLFNEDEMNKILVLQQVKSRFLTQIAGAQRLKLSTRHVRRLLKRLEKEGASGIKRRSSGGNRSHSKTFKSLVLSTVKEKYPDFGPTFASEKLLEIDSLKINKETLRQWMIEEALWKGKSRKSMSLHQTRGRRSQFGELVQIDGSHHDWFEGRRAKCCLLVFIDDATSSLVSLRFEESETSMGYFMVIKSHTQAHGRPLAYYSDRHSIFKTTRANDSLFKDTQVHRALKELKIELICAYSPQAKGRVERSNQTLQDRLVKELRLQDISTIEEANAYFPKFIKAYNKKFSVNPESTKDAHRPVHQSCESLNRILSEHHTRKLSKTLEFSFEGSLYQVQRPGRGYRYRHAYVKIYRHTTGELEVLFNEEVLKIVKLKKNSRGPLLGDRKELDRIFDKEILPNLEEPPVVLPTGSTAPRPPQHLRAGG